MDDRPSTARHRTAGRPRGYVRYEDDLYTWANEQAALLRAGKVADVDASNIAEELDDVGNEQYDKLQSALRLILLHLLKWDHQQSRRSRSWWSTVTVQRNHVRRVLRKNPGLKSRLDQAIAEAYEDARVQVASQTRLRPATFPRRCPYGLKDIMDRTIPWPSDD